MLRGDREPWLMIDPKPLAGDREFGVIPLLWNRFGELDGDRGLRDRFAALCDIGELDAERARAWTFCRAVDTWLWCLDEGLAGMAGAVEAIAAADPDRLFVLDRDTAIGQSGGEAAQQVLDNELVDGTTAAQQDRITYVDSAGWYLVGFGLNNFPAMIGEVQDAVS